MDATAGQIHQDCTQSMLRLLSVPLKRNSRIIFAFLAKTYIQVITEYGQLVLQSCYSGVCSIPTLICMLHFLISDSVKAENP